MSVPAQAASGSGGGSNGGGGGASGGGSTSSTSIGVIKNPVSAAVTCSGGSRLGLTVRKGNNKVVEEVLTMSGTTEGFWMLDLNTVGGQMLVNQGFGENDLGTATAIRTTSTGSQLAKGTWALTFRAVRHQLVVGVADPLSTPIVETCTASLTVVAV